MVKYFHWYILKDQNWPVSDQWQLHKMPTKKEGKMIELGEEVKLWWDKTVQVDHAVQANQPNIVLLDRKNLHS
eukprot:15365291-Ditylum_brightwellii.AAC.1